MIWLVAGVVGDEVAVDRGHPAGRGWLGVTGVAEVGGVHVQHAARAPAPPAMSGAPRVPVWGADDGVPDRAELQRDEVVELVAAVGGGGQAEPAAGGDLADGVLEGGGRDVVALVDDDQPVAGGQLRDVVGAGQGLQGGDVDDRRWSCCVRRRAGRP